ncbi:DUF4184 family protein [Tessaracoccus antarcticus]|uniref:DUF4184 family protein n=1 Tax=Tessaracoccus antarcticus TaxID=2479848 RepID=A0A3M0GAZ9_9ACTN|nr:DUF4184 family protein [Tessaracoccus antarcticus]RMB58159.1 DUF4184 family protein [Tessaracoccus antarcticus]
MPFTPAHVAAVLPLRGRPYFPFAALAAGSMSPDLPYFLPFSGSIPRHVTHSVWSIPTWDLLFGMALWLVWRWVAPIVHDVAPRPVRTRWTPPTGQDPAWLGVVAAVVVGSATHILWDALTHAGYLTSVIGPLAAIHDSPLGRHHGYSYLQYASGALGLAVLLWVGFRQPPRSPGPRRQPGTAAAAPAIVIAAALLAVALRVTTMHDPTDRRAMVFTTVTSSISGAALGVIVVCVAHALIDLRVARHHAA